MIVPDPPLPNSYWVYPGQLLAGEYPGAPRIDLARKRVERLLDAGINFFVDLTMPDELPPYSPELPMSAEHMRMPIFDHDVPMKPEEMVEILRTIKRALEADKRVYVHCRAGIGRTGTVIGCLLADTGISGDDALYELNRLWQQCARSRSWPAVPETDAQVEYVRRWDAQRYPATLERAQPLTRQQPSAPVRMPPAVVPPAKVFGSGRAILDAPSPAQQDPPFEVYVPTPGVVQLPARNTRERYLGALIGLAIGDALGAVHQQQPPGSFEPISDLVGGGFLKLPRGAWTDDTAMALCLAESLLESRGFDARDQVERYARWQQSGYMSATGVAVGITPNTARSIAVAQWRRQLFAGSHDPKLVEPSPLSRMAPAVMFYLLFRDQALEFAGDAVRTTCQAPLVLNVCRLFAAMVHAALEGKPKPEVLAPPWELPADRPKSRIRGLIEGRYRKKDPAVIHAGDHVLDTLEVALWAFDRTNSFADGALLVANAGENSDVAGAVYGQLAGAYYGVEAIPAPWRNSLIKKDLIESLALRLLDQTKVGAAG